jgi:hypothetical protein
MGSVLTIIRRKTMCRYQNLKSEAWFGNNCPLGLTKTSTLQEIAKIAATATIEASQKQYILYDILNYLREWKDKLINSIA